jgi:aldehyde oxidoreductase
METDWSVDHGPYSEFGDLLTLRGTQFIGAGYNIPNIRGNGRTVCTNHAWGSAFRGYGSPQSEFASESLMDMLAEKLGMDPFELRYKNCLPPRRHHAHGPGAGSVQPAGPADKLRPKYEAAKEKAKKESTAPEEGRGHFPGHLRLRPGRPGLRRGLGRAEPDDTFTITPPGRITARARTSAPWHGPRGPAPLGIAPEKIHFTWSERPAKCPNRPLRRQSPAAGGHGQRHQAWPAKSWSRPWKNPAAVSCTYAEMKSRGKAHQVRRQMDRGRQGLRRGHGAGQALSWSTCTACSCPRSPWTPPPARPRSTR